MCLPDDCRLRADVKGVLYGIFASKGVAEYSGHQFIHHRVGAGSNVAGLKAIDDKLFGQSGSRGVLDQIGPVATALTCYYPVRCRSVLQFDDAYKTAHTSRLKLNL